MSALWEILVPTIRNNGKPFRTKHHKEWDKQVKRITGGLTVLRPAKGQWVAPTGHEFNERMIPVRIMCGEEDIKEIARRTIKHYDQLAVFYYKVSEDCRIMHR